MSRSVILAPLAAALLLPGCAGSAYRGLESPHQPVVSRAEYSIDLATAAGGLATGEQQRLADWLGTMRLGYGDAVYVDDANAQNPAVVDDVADAASRHGILLSRNAPVTSGTAAPGTARVVVVRSRASVPGCPDLRGVDQPNFDAHTDTNYGCAVNSNLAAMVAQPQDLVRGQPGAGTTDPSTAIKAIDTFRNKEPTGKGDLKDAGSMEGN
ncbi:CpaD family pilus assembly lipoprotein [Stakelama saccharophila]|uniref:CpaD family pilus assembly lipoprotein n=1 Tax=Stakelama saccharophila TaxID=3075605 RepID=A0ABZ0B7D6_9SPHN|nr:CpaD family pilus assembly lipoprotein [Stakelama sp. W311]WNO53331.1 CpaD family pilus assembly lipoprotein [Stakelama sp. W311]